ncbi:MAG: coenzyme F420-0:L-glutamate ligase [Anaerolineae bacterium]|nr:coenzyme F420-0:L-glutamate ligase [Anaerolineae bacterium]
MNAPELTLTGVPGVPIVQPGDDLARLVAQSLREAGLILQPGDALVVTSKIVSKAEGRLLDLRTVTPSARAEEVAAQVNKDPRIVEVILRESVEISRMAPNVLIVTHRLGFTSANAGVDQSNVGLGPDWALLLPEDPDRSAQALRARIAELTGVAPGVVITDTHGRPFRMGNINVAIGVAGLPALWDQRGNPDLFGRILRATITAPADEIAAAAGLITGQANESIPVVLVRGLALPELEGRAADLNRPKSTDLYR